MAKLFDELKSKIGETAPTAPTSTPDAPAPKKGKSNLFDELKSKMAKPEEVRAQTMVEANQESVAETGAPINPFTEGHQHTDGKVYKREWGYSPAEMEQLRLTEHPENFAAIKDQKRMYDMNMAMPLPADKWDAMTMPKQSKLPHEQALGEATGMQKPRGPHFGRRVLERIKNMPDVFKEQAAKTTGAVSMAIGHSTPEEIEAEMKKVTDKMTNMPESEWMVGQVLDSWITALTELPYQLAIGTFSGPVAPLTLGTDYGLKGYADAKLEGYTDKEAATKGVLQGVIQATLQKVLRPIEKMTKGTAPVKTGLAEAGEETVQQFSEPFVDYAALGKDKIVTSEGKEVDIFSPAGLWENAKRAGYAGLIGFMVGDTATRVSIAGRQELGLDNIPDDVVDDTIKRMQENTSEELKSELSERVDAQMKIMESPEPEQDVQEYQRQLQEELDVEVGTPAQLDATVWESSMSTDAEANLALQLEIQEDLYETDKTFDDTFGKKDEDLTIKERVQRFGRTVLQGTYDPMRAQRKLVERMRDQLGDSQTRGLIEQLSMQNQTQALMNYVNGVGDLEVFTDKNGRIDLRQGKANGGFNKLMSDMGGRENIGKTMAWIILKRDARDDRKLLKREQRDSLLETVQGFKPNLEHIKRLSDMNKNIVNIGVKFGLIDPKRAKEFETEFYLPIHRIMTEEHYVPGEGDGQPMHASSEVIRDGIRRAYGSDRIIENPVLNLQRVWNHIISASMMNRARGDFIKAMKQWKGSELNGLIDIIPEKDAYDSATVKTTDPDTKKENFVRIKKKLKPGVMGHSVGGQMMYYFVHDQHLYDAMTNKRPDKINDLWRFLGIPTVALRTSIVLSPLFAGKNFVRDAAATTMLEEDFMPWDSLIGWYKTIRRDKSYLDAMAAGLDYDRYDITRDAKSADKYLKKVAMDKNTYNPARPVKEFYGRVMQSMEMAARVQLFDKLRNKGLTEMEAAHRARELLDFNTKGNHENWAILTTLVPFTNSRAQGLRAIQESWKRDPNSLVKKAGMASIATLMLWMQNKDDERYDNLTINDKAAYWHIWIGDVHIRIPKPFELGALVGTGVEMIADLFNGNRDGQAALDMAWHVANDVMRIDAPPAFKVPYELLTNTDTYRERDIVPYWDEQKLPEAQYKPWTSETVKRVASKYGMSPMKVEHATRALFGYLADHALVVSDAVLEKALDLDKPARHVSDNPWLTLLSAGMISVGERPSTRYSAELNRQMKAIREVITTWDGYITENNVDGLVDLLDTRGESLGVRELYENADRDIKDVSASMKAIHYTPGLKPDERRELLDVQLEKRKDLMKMHSTLLKEMVEDLMSD